MGIQGVVAPSALPPAGNESRVLEDLEMKREERLLEIEAFHELTNAAFARRKLVQDGEPVLVREGLESFQDGRGAGQRRHGERIYQ